MSKYSKIEAWRNYWLRYEHGQWMLYAFTGLDSASYRNQRTGEIVQVMFSFMDHFNPVKPGDPDHNFDYGKKHFDPSNPWGA